MPRRAQQETFDVETYTVWTVTLNEGVFGSSLPMEVAVLALDEIGRLLGSHGPASLYFGISERIFYSYGFLNIREVAGVSLNQSLANGNSYFHSS